MANKTVIDYQQMTQIAGQFGDLSSNVESVISAIQSQRDEIRSKWTGSGADAFQADVGDQLIPALQRLKSALSSARETTNQIMNVYHQAEGGASGQIIHTLRNFNQMPGGTQGQRHPRPEGADWRFSEQGADQPGQRCFWFLLRWSAGCKPAGSWPGQSTDRTAKFW